MTIKIDGVSYERIKCPNCGKKVLYSHERQDFCPSCGSELIIDTISGRKEIRSERLRILAILSIIGGVLGATISTIWGILNYKVIELIWIIPIGTTIGTLVPLVVYILIILLLGRLVY
ncbi:MAG: hypothetical protein ACFFBH_08380 [Promethearchaeota archaeon]